jgi:YihY family inner membrane protein
MKIPSIDILGIKEKIRPVYNLLNHHLHGALDVLRFAAQNFARERASEAAASLAYFTFFSLFPIILVLISFASFVLKSQMVQDQIFGYIIDIFPISPEIVENNIVNVLSRRGTVGFIAIIGLMWSASSVFTILSLNIDRAWPENASHNYFERRLMGFAILIGLGVIIIVLWFLRALLQVDFISQLLIYFQVPIFNTTLWDLIVFISPRLFRFLMFWIMYQWLPKANVKMHEAFWGAAVTTILTELITQAMSWYLSSQWVRYELVYGSLGRIIAMLLWIYFSSFVILFGAHISSSVAKVAKQKKLFSKSDLGNLHG